MRADLPRRAAAELGLDDFVDDAREDFAVLFDEGIVSSRGDDLVVVCPCGSGRFSHPPRARPPFGQVHGNAVLKQQTERVAATMPNGITIRALTVCSRGEQRLHDFMSFPLTVCDRELERTRSGLTRIIRIDDSRALIDIRPRFYQNPDDSHAIADTTRNM